MLLKIMCIVSAVVAAVMMLLAATLALIAKDAGTTSLTAEIIAVWAILPGTFSVVMAFYLGSRWTS